MGQFVRDVRASTRTTGNPLQVYEASRHMKRSFEQAAWYALLVIIPVVLLDFRRLNHTLLAALPMGVGLLQTLGLMDCWTSREPRQYDVLPLTLGIGMESGVNLLHELRSQRGAYRGAGNAVTVAVVVNSLTTMVARRPDDRQPSGAAKPRTGVDDLHGLLHAQRDSAAQSSDRRPLRADQIETDDECEDEEHDYFDDDPSSPRIRRFPTPRDALPPHVAEKAHGADAEEDKLDGSGRRWTPF